MNSFFRSLFIPALVSMFPLSAVLAQAPADSIDAVRALAPKVFVDCQSCDEDYIKTEIAFVNYVRDRKEAQVHVLLTTQTTGSGGTEHTLTFIGQAEFAGMDDTLAFVTNQGDTDDMKRKEMVKTMKLGLTKYVLKTPMGKRLSVVYDKPEKPGAVTDKWDYWVLSVEVSSWLNGEKSASYANIWGGLNVRRVTEEWKLRLGFSFSHNENRYNYNGATFTSISRSQWFNGTVVKSLRGQWSAGLFGEVYASTYNNVNVAYEVSPAIEYNFFPYSESTRRELRLSYRIGTRRAIYKEETIYDKSSETLLGHVVSGTVELRQPWGTTQLSVEFSQYFHDLSKRRLTTYADIAVRLVEGLSLKIYGQYLRINDQLSLPKQGATQEEVLLQRRELESSYRYYGSVGFSYTFGSIYSNIVNPRFGD